MAAPGFSRQEIATKAELRQVEGSLRTEIANFRTEVVTEFGNVRTEMAEMKGELKTEIAGVRGEVRELRGEVKVWLIVLGAILTVVSSGFGNRMLNLLWPPDAPGAPQGAAPWASTW